MLESVRDLRKEREKLKELQNQKSEQRTAISHGDQRIARLENQLKEMRQALTRHILDFLFFNEIFPSSGRLRWGLLLRD